MRAITGPGSHLDVETARIEAVASAHRLISIAESGVLVGFRSALETGCAVIRAVKKLSRDHASDHRPGDAAQEAARHHAAEACAARLAEHALRRARLTHFGARGEACERLRAKAVLLGEGAFRGRDG